MTSRENCRESFLNAVIFAGNGEDFAQAAAKAAEATMIAIREAKKKALS